MRPLRPSARAMSAPSNATMNRLAKGQTWRNVGGTAHGKHDVGKTFTIGSDGQGEYKDSFLCLWAPSEGLGHIACPCVYDEIRRERCYFASALCMGGLSVIVWDDGKKMNTACCGLRVHYELVEPTVVAGGERA